MNELEKIVSENPGMQFMPIKESKVPIFQDWQNAKKQYDFKDQTCIGLICGEISEDIEAIDIDLKYDLSSSLYDDFKKSIQDKDPSLLSLLVVQKTLNNGYHFIYRCDEIGGNKKLASRPATEEEKAKGEKVKVLIETRGQGGYIVIAPTKGYRFVYNTLSQINRISPEQRAILFESAYEFNEVLQDSVQPKQDRQTTTGLSPFEDYDQRGDVTALLQRHGWKPTNTRGNKTFFLRPGESKAKSSGNYDAALNRFSVFSTSTEFEAERGYKPYAVYAYLECNKDFSEASKKLYKEGFGERLVITPKTNNNSSCQVKNNKEDNSISNIKIVKLETVRNTMLKTFRNGKVRGETTHFHSMDPHFTWKKDSLICLTGYPGHGKTELMLNLMLAKAVHSNWKWALFSPENMPADELYDSLIHSYIGKSTDKTFSNYMTLEDYERGMKFINDHFFLVDPETPTLDSILENFKYLVDHEKVDGCLIDPWNQMQHNVDGREDLYLSNQLLKAKKFCRAENLVMVISAHPVKPTIEKEVLPTPNEYSLSGGAMWNNKCDIILVVHRPSYYLDSTSKDVQLISRKIKKQKLIGIPGTINLTFDRPSNRYLESNGNTPLSFIEVPVASTYLKSLGLN